VVLPVVPAPLPVSHQALPARFQYSKITIETVKFSFCACYWWSAITVGPYPRLFAATNGTDGTAAVGTRGIYLHKIFTLSHFFLSLSGLCA